MSSSSSAKAVRDLVSNATTASLGTLDPDHHPYVSLVSIAAVGPTEIALLLSDLAKHARYLATSGNASLLVSDDTVSPSERMAAARVTLSGFVRRLERQDDAPLRQAFLALHPQAAMYSDFGDFSMYQFQVNQAHLVAGFGKIQTVSAEQLKD